MPISIQFLRDHPEQVRASENGRNYNRHNNKKTTGELVEQDFVSQTLYHDAQWRPLARKKDDLKHRANELQKEIAKLKKMNKKSIVVNGKDVLGGTIKTAGTTSTSEDAGSTSGPPLDGARIFTSSSSAVLDCSQQDHHVDEVLVGLDVDVRIQERKKVVEEIEATTKAEQDAKENRDFYLHKIGNILHEDVPIGRRKAAVSTEINSKPEQAVVVEDSVELYRTDCSEVRRTRIREVVTSSCTTRGLIAEQDNDREKIVEPLVEEVSSITKATDHIFKPDALLPHYELLRKFKMVDHVRGAKVAGSRAYFLTGLGVKFNFALQQYAIQFLTDKQKFGRDYQLLAPPLYMRGDLMAQTAELEDFDDQLYKMTTGTTNTSTATASSSSTANVPKIKKNDAVHDEQAGAPENNPGADNAGRSDPLGGRSFTPSARGGPPAGAATAPATTTSSHQDHQSSYLIATSEQPLSAFYANEHIDSADLPIRLAGVSTCFRREQASHGYDVKGLFRLNQFDKVEQFGICQATWSTTSCAPTTSISSKTKGEQAQQRNMNQKQLPPPSSPSEQLLQEFLQTSEEFYRSLGLDYRIVEIVSGAMNNAASHKFDLEAAFPGSAAVMGRAESVATGSADQYDKKHHLYRELVSCSNCTDYQSRALNVTTTVIFQNHEQEASLVGPQEDCSGGSSATERREVEAKENKEKHGLQKDNIHQGSSNDGVDHVHGSAEKIIKPGNKKINSSNPAPANNKKPKKEKQFVHFVNATLCATQRTLCCLLENYQTKDGVVVPEVLKPYLDGKDFFPFAVP
ncbi:unnamed protein product [Amoebophrya sp. A120]|nr:unnamed protein product [Amoebophrya sp. A120]|eukprot:GSA120T00020461001.1